MVVGRAVNINSKSKSADKVSQAAPAVKSTDMAAAAMAKKHVMGAAKVVYDPTREKMPGDAECWITGELGRQIVTQVGVSYQRRFVKVSKDSVCFGKMGCPIMIDYVPLLEIESVGGQGAETGLEKSKSCKLGDFKRRLSGGNDRMSREAQRWDDEEEDSEYPFVIYTQADGHTSGRNVVLNARNQEELARWTKAIDDARNEARLESIRSSDTHYLAPYMRKVAAWYNSNLVQYSVAVVIFASYGIAIVNSQLLPPPGSDSEYYMKLAEWIFTSIFALELAVNLFGHWFWPFFNCTWNCFDFLVVGCSVVSLIIPALPGISVLRLLRVFKMIRLFQQLQSLRILINALSTSVLPVLNSFAILLLVTSIYAVLATDFFGQKHHEFFGSFSKSIFTLFQVSTGDAWASIVTRALLSYDEESGDFGEPRLFVALVSLFFVSYVLIVGVVLMNIVIAVLLDEFISTVDRERTEAKARAVEEESKNNPTSQIISGPLDSLIKGLMTFTTREDLSDRINTLYQRIDLDESGAVDLAELNAAMKKINVTPPVRLSTDDWDLVTEHGALLNKDGELTPPMFEKMLLSQIASFTRRKVVNAMSRIDDEVDGELMFALKMLMCTVDQLTNTEQKPGRSRKETLAKLFNAPLIRSFGIWKQTYQEGSKQPEQEGSSAESPGAVPSSNSEVQKQLSQMHEMHVGMHEASLSEMRNLGEQMAKMTQDLCAVTAVVTQLCKVLPSPSYMPGSTIAQEGASGDAGNRSTRAAGADAGRPATVGSLDSQRAERAESERARMRERDMGWRVAQQAGFNREPSSEGTLDSFSTSFTHPQLLADADGGNVSGGGGRRDVPRVPVHAAAIRDVNAAYNSNANNSSGNNRARGRHNTHVSASSRSSSRGRRVKSPRRAEMNYSPPRDKNEFSSQSSLSAAATREALTSGGEDRGRYMDTMRRQGGTWSGVNTVNSSTGSDYVLVRPGQAYAHANKERAGRRRGDGRERMNQVLPQHLQGYPQSISGSSMTHSPPHQTSDPMARREPWASQQPNYTNGDPGRGREVEGASGWEGGESSRDPLNQSSNAFASSALSLALALEQRMVDRIEKRREGRSVPPIADSIQMSPPAEPSDSYRRQKLAKSLSPRRMLHSHGLLPDPNI